MFCWVLWQVQSALTLFFKSFSSSELFTIFKKNFWATDEEIPTEIKFNHWDYNSLWCLETVLCARWGYGMSINVDGWDFSLIIRGELLVWTKKADHMAKTKTKQNRLQSLYPDWFSWKLDPMILRVTSVLEFYSALKLVAIFHQLSNIFHQQSIYHPDQTKLQLLSKYILNVYYVHCAGC